MTDLQTLIDGTPAGGVLTLSPGVYTARNPVDLRRYGLGYPTAFGAVVSKPMTIQGAGVIVDGTLFLMPGAAGATLRGLTSTLLSPGADTAAAIQTGQAAGVLGGFYVFADDVSMDSLRAFGCALTGIAWESGCQGGSLANSRIFANGSHSLYIQNAGRIKTISGCYIGSPLPQYSSYSLHGYGHLGPCKGIRVTDTAMEGPLVAVESAAGVDDVVFDRCSFTRAGLMVGQGCGQNGSVTLSRCTLQDGRQSEFHNLTTLTLDRCSFDISVGGVLIRYDLGWTGTAHYLHATGTRLLSAPGGFGLYAWGTDTPPAVFEGVTPRQTTPGTWKA